MFDDELMDKVLKKCKEDPEYLNVFERFMEMAQLAPTVGMTMEEMANICTMGYVIGKDPTIQDMIGNMLKINKLGLDIKED